MKLNEEYEVKIIDDNHNGNGICKIDDVPVFVRNAVALDIVKIKITKVTKKYAQGEIKTFIKPSKNRVVPICKYYEKCGGCNLMHISYEKELKTKEEYLEKLFKNKFQELVFLDRYNYRNKVTFHVKQGKMGFYDEKTNDLICISSCDLLDREINELMVLLSKFDLSKISDIVIRKGDRVLLLYITGNIMREDLEKLKNYKQEITVYQNDELLYGKPFIISTVGNIKYLINHKAFFQVNSKCCNRLYEEVKKEVGSSKRLLDLYCGIGSIGLYLASICDSVVGVEINKESVKCARENIRLNNINNYEVIQGDASIVCDDFDTVVVDPPRSGLSKMVIKNLNEMNIDKLIYISCNPSTLKRDIDLLTKYELVKVKGFNMFPCTKHVECVCVLKLK